MVVWTLSKLNNDNHKKTAYQKNSKKYRATVKLWDEIRSWMKFRALKILRSNMRFLQTRYKIYAPITKRIITKNDNLEDITWFLIPDF